MIIRKMTASYGGLGSGSLELRPGLNIVTAPNESGKSTWCSFINNMLYGVDSSARERGGVKPDKLRFAPWSGAPMSGSMDIEHEGREISLSRTGTAKAPMRELTAVLTGTAQSVPGLSDNVGESLLGIPREVFERSAFIGQGGIPMSASPELEKRIASIVQTGDEALSCSDATEQLRGAMRRRRHNKSGRLPEIERERETLEQKLRGIDSEHLREAQLISARDIAIAKRDELTEKVAEERKLQRRRTLDTMTEERRNVEALEAEYSATHDAELIAEQELLASRFAAEEPRELRARAAADIELISQLHQKARRGGPLMLNVLLILLPGLVGILSLLIRQPFGDAPTFTGGALALAALIRLIWLVRKRRGIHREIAQVFARYGAENAEELWDAVDAHAEAFEGHRSLAEKCSALQLQLSDAKRRQESREGAILKDLDFSPGEDEGSSLSLELERAESHLRSIREELAVCTGRISATGSREALLAQIEALNSEHEKLSLEYEALALAAATISEAGTEIQNRMTPRLSQRSSEIFSRLTNGRYDAVTLDRELKALTRLSGDALARESAFLSTGALDQLYLAVRLAICELALPEGGAPLILDDALGSFDDERCRAALDFLLETAESRQVIVFSCHTREARMMEGVSGVNIIHMQ